MPETLLPREFPGGRLRRMNVRDLSSFQAYRSLPELGRYQGWSVMTDAEALRFLDEMHHSVLLTPGEWVQLGIADPQSDALVGDIGLYVAQDGRSGEVGFTLQPSAQGRGVASRAVRAAVQVLFEATSVTRVLGITDERNRPSIRLLERIGFKLEESREVVFRGEPCTERVYVLARNAHVFSEPG
jgi:RimJ/RimL family protein N-acetyltransferase